MCTLRSVFYFKEEAIQLCVMNIRQLNLLNFMKQNDKEETKRFFKNDRKGLFTARSGTQSFASFHPAGRAARFTERNRCDVPGKYIHAIRAAGIKNRLRFSVVGQIRYNDSDKLKRMPKGYRGRAVD